MKQPPEAIIADDEPQLRSYLKLRLKEAWPDLCITGEAKNGLEAIELIDTLNPDIAFLDIKMPGLSGIEVAQKMIGRCRVVFITAYDHYAVEAFESEAVDYLLKPVVKERLEQTVERLKKQISTPPAPQGELADMMDRLMMHIQVPTPKDYLKWINVQHRDTIRLIPVDDILYFKSSEKYTTLLSTAGEALISKPIKDLVEELDPDAFWQIHRSTIVNVRCIAEVSRSLTGRYVIRLKGTDDLLTVSRTYAHRFKQM